MERCVWKRVRWGNVGLLCTVMALACVATFGGEPPAPRQSAVEDEVAGAEEGQGAWRREEVERAEEEDAGRQEDGEGAGRQEEDDPERAEEEEAERPERGGGAAREEDVARAEDGEAHAQPREQRRERVRRAEEVGGRVMAAEPPVEDTTAVGAPSAETVSVGGEGGSVVVRPENGEFTPDPGPWDE
jgi:hypothetical protein